MDAWSITQGFQRPVTSRLSMHIWQQFYSGVNLSEVLTQLKVCQSRNTLESSFNGVITRKLESISVYRITICKSLFDFSHSNSRQILNASLRFKRKHCYKNTLHKERVEKSCESRKLSLLRDTRL